MEEFMRPIVSPQEAARRRHAASFWRRPESIFMANVKMGSGSLAQLRVRNDANQEGRSRKENQGFPSVFFTSEGSSDRGLVLGGFTRQAPADDHRSRRDPHCVNPPAAWRGIDVDVFH
jgi:hypothetical protein